MMKPAFGGKSAGKIEILPAVTPAPLLDDSRNGDDQASILRFHLLLPLLPPSLIAREKESELPTPERLRRAVAVPYLRRFRERSGALRTQKPTPSALPKSSTRHSGQGFMLTFTIRQFFYSLLIIWGVMTVTFVIIRVLPGDPARLMLGQRADAQSIAALRKQLKLDEPIFPTQYFDFLGRAATGDLGRSFAFNRPVIESILERFPKSLVLAVPSLLIATLIGVAIGVYSAWKPYTFFDGASRVTAILGISVPVFVLGAVLILVFSNWLNLLPASGYITKDGGTNLKYLLLPMLALAARPLSIIARITRSSMLDVLSQDYIRTARAKGLPVGATVIKHALRNALNPVVTTVSAWLASTIAGTFFIEKVFAWPGIGMLGFDAVLQLDYPVIQGVVLFTAVVFVVVNFLVDILYSLLDPKVRLS